MKTLRINFLKLDINIENYNEYTIKCFKIIDEIISENIKILNENQIMDSYNNNPITIENAFCEIKNIINNNSLLERQLFEWFANIIILEGSNENIKNALSEQLPEKKKIKVIASRPFRNNISIVDYFIKLFSNKELKTIGNEYILYKEIFNIFSNKNIDLNQLKIYKEINNFISKYYYLKKIWSPKKYNELEEEFRKLLTIPTKDEYIEQFYKEHPDYTFSYDEITDFYNMVYQPKDLIGEIGELYIYNYIKGLINDKSYYKEIIHVAKDVGDGFGYDIYLKSIKDNRIIESLIEVKTTLASKDKDNDRIIISPNEINKRITEKIKENISYLIVRVFIDSDEKEIEKAISFYTLKFDEDSKRLICVSDSNIVYYLKEINEYKRRKTCEVIYSKEPYDFKEELPKKYIKKLY